MIRGLFNIAVVLSLALFAIVLAVWLRGFWRQDMLIFGQLGSAATIIESDGRWMRITRVDAWPVDAMLGWHSASQFPREWTSAGSEPLVSPVAPDILGIRSRWHLFGIEILSGPMLLLDPVSPESPYTPISTFLLRVNSGTDIGNGWMVYVPLWHLFGAALFLPVAWVLLRIRRACVARRRRAGGLCLTCGYDLRAHNPGDRCPECGTPIVHGVTNVKLAC